jgi:acetylglutamate kinase
VTRNPIVVKLGGALLESDLSSFWEQILLLQVFAPVVLVHGGGPQATDLASKLGHSPRIVEGRRVTDDLDLDTILYAVSGLLNTRLVAGAGAAGITAVGLTGADGKLIQVHRRETWLVQGESVDFGHVGDIDQIEVTLLNRLLMEDTLPVISPPGVDLDGNLYNVNADTVALEVAVALKASELVLVTDSSGVRRDADQEVLDQTVSNGIEPDILTEIDPVIMRSGLKEGWIHSGMQVKLSVGMEALDRGVKSVWIAGINDLIDKKNATRLCMGEVEA